MRWLLTLEVFNYYFICVKGVKAHITSCQDQSETKGNIIKPN